MLSSNRMLTRPARVLGPFARIFIIAFTVSAAGCSADVTRFDFGGGRTNTTSSIPVPSEPVGNGYSPGAHPRGLGVSEAPLPPADAPPGGYRAAGRQYDAPPAPFSEPSPRLASAPERSSYQPSPSEPPGNYRVVGRQYNTPPPRPFSGPESSFPQQPASGGETIDVQPGETLYSISRRTGIPVAAIKQANGLSSDGLRPGTRLVLPAGAQERGPFAASPPPAQRAPLGKYAAPAGSPPVAPERTAALDNSTQPAVEPPPGWGGRYTMRNGDSLYGIAHRHKVTLEDLKRANGITDPTKVWTGTVLNVPSQSDTAAAATPPAGTAPRVVQTPPRIINAAPEAERTPDRKLASRGDIANDAGEPSGAETVAGKFRWPVRGRVIAGFGRRPDGTHNDGVNVAVSQGTEVQAAESGKVVYAGNELKGYGNLVLIRHPNGYVTAYAHADQILVKANDDVRRGQVIARAGRTGAVDQPQLHFELRQGSRPIDPLPHLVN